MPRYFFDIDDGHRTTRDYEGHEFPDRSAVRDEALRALPTIIADELPDSDRRIFSVKVRDERDVTVYFVTLTLVAEWLE